MALEPRREAARPRPARGEGIRYGKILGHGDPHLDRSGGCGRDPGRARNPRAAAYPAPSAHVDGQAQLIDRVVGVRARYLEELLIRRLLRFDTEALGRGVPFVIRRLERGFGTLAAPDGGAHAIDGERI